MKILLSAYACEPYKGSEPYVGWNWVNSLSKQGHEVWVITRKNNRQIINDFLSKNSLAGVKFIYYDLPKVFLYIKNGNRGVHLYYLLWQIGIYFVCKQLCKKIKFSLIHHVTFVTARQPSFLGLLGIPFIPGPIAGGERSHFKLLESFLIIDKLFEYLRLFSNYLIKYNPLMHLTFNSASKIIVTSIQTKNVIPKVYHPKIIENLAVGIDKNEIKSNFTMWGGEQNNKFRIMYAGRILHWKGLHIVLNTYAHLLKSSDKFELSIIGSGSRENWVKTVANKLNVYDNIKWVKEIDRNELNNYYAKSDAFLFPSLHDSGGMVILEALSFGLPVICLDIGGPSKIINEECGFIIDTSGKNVYDISVQISKKLLFMSKNRNLCKQLSKNAKKRILDFEWLNVTKNIYKKVLIEDQK